MKLFPVAGFERNTSAGVRLAEALDEGAEDDRDGDEHHGHDHLEDPPVHVQLSILIVGREKDERRERGEGGGGAERHAGAEPPAPAVLLHAALHAGEQVGRGLDVVGARVQGVAASGLRACSSVALQSLFERGEASLQMGLHRVR